MKPATAAKETASRPKRTKTGTAHPVKKRVKERSRKRREGGKAFEAEHFGRPPAGATHCQLGRKSARGTLDRMYLTADGIEQDKFPLSIVSVANLRRTFGSGVYRGTWFVEREGKWTPLGRTREIRIAPLSGVERTANVVRLPAGRVGGVIASEGEPPPAAPATSAADEREATSALVRAERDASRIRIEAMTEASAFRLAALREEHEHAINRLEARVVDLEDEDDDRPPQQAAIAAPQGPWAFLAPFLERMIPALETVLLPRLLGQPPAVFVGHPTPPKDG